MLSRVPPTSEEVLAHTFHVLLCFSHGQEHLDLTFPLSGKRMCRTHLQHAFEEIPVNSASRHLTEPTCGNMQLPFGICAFQGKEPGRALYTDQEPRVRHVSNLRAGPGDQGFCLVES